MWKVQNDSTPCSNARCQKLIKLAKSAYLAQRAGPVQLSTVGNRDRQESGRRGRPRDKNNILNI